MPAHRWLSATVVTCTYTAMLLTGAGSAGAAAAQDPGSIERATACRVLAKDASARAAFPDGGAYLCGKPRPRRKAPPKGRGKGRGRSRAAEPAPAGAPDCSARSAEACAKDVDCAPAYAASACAGAACPPSSVYTGCQPTPPAALATRIRHFAICKTSGGSWLPLPTRTPEERARRQSGCSCMGAAPAAVLATRDGATDAPGLTAAPALYVGERGCIPEQQLCDEHGGAWLAAPLAYAQDYLTKNDCMAKPKYLWDPQVAPLTGTCTVGGTPPSVTPCSESDYKDLLRDKREVTFTPFAAGIGGCRYEVAASKTVLSRSVCRIDGEAARWRTLGEPVGFPY